MKTIIVQLCLLMLIGIIPVMAQKTDRRAEKEKKRIAKEQEIAALVNSKTFEFRAVRAIPTGYRSVDLTTNPNFVRFEPDMIVSEMPYFGRAYSVTYGGDGGLKFEGKPDIYTIEKGKKGYSIEVKVKGVNDSYIINLSVSFGGNSTMNISSNNRASISYNGEIFAYTKPEEKK